MANALLNLINFNCLFEIAKRKSNHNAEESFGFRVCTHFARRKSNNASLNLCLAPLSSHARSCRTREFCVHRVVLVNRKISMKIFGGWGASFSSKYFRQIFTTSYPGPFFFSSPGSRIAGNEVVYFLSLKWGKQCLREITRLFNGPLYTKCYN